MTTNGVRQGETEPYGAYGVHLANCFDLVKAPTHNLRTLKRGIIAVTHLELNAARPDLTNSIRCDDAFLLVVHLRDLMDHELWLDDRLVTRAPLRSGATHIYNLERDPRARVFQPASTLHFYLPRVALNEFADQNDISPISELAYTPGMGADDPVMAHVSHAVVEAFRRPHATTGLFLDQILHAVCAHTLSQYGNARHATVRHVCGLAPWQERRAKELMDQILDISLSQIAESCQLSVTHFVRAFRKSTGLSPHQWLIRRRVNKAMALLSDENLSIADIALACGFSSQSHLNRAFAPQTGVPPGRWRRLHRRASRD